jgi:hypothetical protein
LSIIRNITELFVVSQKICNAPSQISGLGRDKELSLLHKDGKFLSTSVTFSFCTTVLAIHNVKWQQHSNNTGNNVRNVTSRYVRPTIVAVEKQWVLHNLYVPFVALGIQHELRMCHIVICGLPRSTKFFHISPKRNDLKKKKLLSMKCLFRVSLQILSETFFNLKSTERDMVTNYICVHEKYPFFLSDFNETWLLSTDFRKILKYHLSEKYVQWEPSFSTRTDGQTDRHLRTWLPLFTILRTHLKTK